MSSTAYSVGLRLVSSVAGHGAESQAGGRVSFRPTRRREKLVDRLKIWVLEFALPLAANFRPHPVAVSNSKRITDIRTPLLCYEGQCTMPMNRANTPSDLTFAFKPTKPREGQPAYSATT